MKICKSFIALIFTSVYLVSGCSTTDSVDKAVSNPKQSMVETIVNSDSSIDAEKSKNNNISSDSNLQSYSYIANKNTKKFHFDYCVSVRQMKKDNKEYLNCTYDEAISQSYKPCKKCSPR